MQILLQLLNYSKKHAQTINIALVAVIASGSIAGGIHIRNLTTIIAEKNTLLQQSATIAAQRDALERQRLAAVEATWQARLDDAVASTATVKREIDGIRTDSKRRRTEVKALQDLFERHLQTDEEIIERAEELLIPEPEPRRRTAAQALAATTQVRGARAESNNAVHRSVLARLAENVARTREDKLRSDSWIKWSDDRIEQMDASIRSEREYPTAATFSPEGRPSMSAASRSRSTGLWSLLVGALAVALVLILVRVARRRRLSQSR